MWKPHNATLRRDSLSTHFDWDLCGKYMTYDNVLREHTEFHSDTLHWGEKVLGQFGTQTKKLSLWATSKAEIMTLPKAKAKAVTLRINLPKWLQITWWGGGVALSRLGARDPTQSTYSFECCKIFLLRFSSQVNEILTVTVWTPREWKSKRILKESREKKHKKNWWWLPLTLTSYLNPLRRCLLTKRMKCSSNTCTLLRWSLEQVPWRTCHFLSSFQIWSSSQLEEEVLVV